MYTFSSTMVVQYRPSLSVGDAFSPAMSVFSSIDVTDGLINGLGLGLGVICLE